MRIVAAIKEMKKRGVPVRRKARCSRWEKVRDACQKESERKSEKNLALGRRLESRFSRLQGESERMEDKSRGWKRERRRERFTGSFRKTSDSLLKYNSVIRSETERAKEWDTGCDGTIACELREGVSRDIQTRSKSESGISFKREVFLSVLN